MVCYVAVSGFCKHGRTLHLMQHVFVLPLLQKPHMVCSRPWTPTEFFVRGASPNKAPTKKKIPPLGEKGPYTDFLFFREGGTPMLALLRAAMHLTLSLYGK